MKTRMFSIAKTTGICLIATLLINLPGVQAVAASTASDPLNNPVSVPNGQTRLSIESSGENVRTILRNLSQQGGFNLLMDESVTGNITIGLNNVTVNEALRSVAALANLEIIPQSGNIYLAISKEAAQNKGLSRQLSKVIKINYGNANRIAGILNNSILAQSDNAASTSTTGTTAAQKAKADPRTNTIIVVGTAHEIKLAEKAVNQLDIPRQSKTFFLSHANALNVAAQLASSVFNDGTNPLRIGGSGGGSSSGGSSAGGSGTGGSQQQAANPGSIRVEREDVQEGTGVNDFGQNSGSSGGSSGGGSAVSQNITLRGVVKTTDTAQVSPEGPLLIPDTRTNSITVMGTAEQISLAESMIPVFDARLPQVAIEASLVEITSTGTKELGNSLGIADGRFQFGFNNSAGTDGVATTAGLPAGLVGLPTVNATSTLGRSGIGFSTNPLARNNDYLTQVRALITQNKAKILANPTVVATHDTESVISIVDEIIRRVTVETDGITGFTTQTVEIGEAGIVLDILPKVGEDGTLTMRLRPSVTSIREVTEDALENTITLLSKRDLLTQSVRVRDGETLVIGGLISEQDTHSTDQLPGMGNLPIVGAMFRASQRSTSRSELVLLITPHILNETKLTPVSYTSADMAAGKGETQW